MIYPVGHKIKCSNPINSGFTKDKVYSINRIDMHKDYGTSYQILDDKGRGTQVSVYEFEKFFDSAKIKKYNRPSWF